VGSGNAHIQIQAVPGSAKNFSNVMLGSSLERLTLCGGGGRGDSSSIPLLKLTFVAGSSHGVMVSLYKGKARVREFSRST
jgi:hypothetical protein